ncbi:MAG TPA: hypothetical protein VEZ90_09770, partial [Blastocatellia bacterium]|nr:hypothetical protein [Blastocatellia bacterium]
GAGLSGGSEGRLLNAGKEPLALPSADEPLQLGEGSPNPTRFIADESGNVQDLGGRGNANSSAGRGSFAGDEWGNVQDLTTGRGNPNTIPRQGPFESARGVLDDANFAQESYREGFSKGGREELLKITGKPMRTINDLAEGITTRVVDPQRIPVNFVVREGNALMLNTRTVTALERAGVPRNTFNAIDRTGDPLFEQLLTDQLTRNKLTSTEIPEGIITGKKHGPELSYDRGSGR